MKPTTAGVAVFSGLAAVVAADALPMDSIPLQCIKVCGPIVELTSICNTGVDARRRALKRRKVDTASAGVRGPRLHYGRGREGECNGGRCIKERENLEQEKRSFSVIRQAPTSFPPELLAPPEQTQLPQIEAPASSAPRPTRIFPSIENTSALPTAHRPPPPPTEANDGDADDDDDDEQQENGRGGVVPAPTTTIAITTSSTSSTGTTDAVATSTNAAVGAEGDEDVAVDADLWMPDDAEKQCVCMNDSFDVARLTALCASCVDQTGDSTKNINLIVSTCKFEPETYSRESDRVAENVRVKATKPTTQMVMEDGASAAIAQKVGDSGSASISTSRAAVLLTAGAVALVAMVM